MKRRYFLLSAGVLGCTLVKQPPVATLTTHPKFSSYPFSLGVASGDPWPESVVLWTRLAPNPLSQTSLPTTTIPVQWQIATDETMSQVVAKGTVLATPELAHSVRVVAEGLQPGRWYWYQFKAGNEVSPKGRTRTAPAPGNGDQQLKLAMVSCQHYEQGYFTAYRHLAQANLDVVFHLGDYIYEGKAVSGRVRKHLGSEAMDLDTYRLRYALYKTDPDLQAAHAAVPFIVTWDDHEVENDYANDQSQDFVDRAKFLKRRAAAYQAYYEHMPLRPSAQPNGPNMQLYRRFRFGDLVEFSVLDTRQYRDDQACDEKGKGGGQMVYDCKERLDPERSMLGATQEKWLQDGWMQSKTQWNAIAQQQLMAPLEQKLGEVSGFWSDGWDGYAPTRQRLLNFMSQRQLANPVVLGGDLHSFWVTDLKSDYQNEKAPVIATEFVGTSISSGGPNYDLLSSFLPDNPHIKFFESRLRGYIQCTIEPKQWVSQLQVVDTVATPESSLRILASFAVESGKPGAQRI
ncbi:MAG: alkaline phosphatase D family protein [Thermosynechococcaceae cyanobacterium]